MSRARVPQSVRKGHRHAECLSLSDRDAAQTSDRELKAGHLERFRIQTEITDVITVVGLEVNIAEIAVRPHVKLFNPMV